MSEKKKNKRNSYELDLIALNAKMVMLDCIREKNLDDCEYDYVMLEIARQLIQAQANFAADVVNR